MKILFVSQSILPFRGAAGFVTESLASNFDRSSMAVVGEQILGLGRNKRNEAIPRFYYMRTNLSFKGKAKRYFQLFRWMLFPFLLLRMQQIVKREKCDYVLGTFPDNYYLFASYVIAKWNGLGYSSYFHNTYLENRPPSQPLNHWAAKRIQKKVFAYSDHIFVMSEGMQGFYEQGYPGVDKFLPLIHTFEEWPPEIPRDFDVKKDRYDLLLIGNFNSSNIESTARFVEALKRNPRVNIKMFTHVPKFMLKQRGIDADAIDYRGFVKQEDFYSELMDNDICVLTHGFSGGYTQTEYETIFPTRTINFLISGRPILAHSPSFAFLSAFLKKYDCAEVVDEASEEAVIKSVEYLLDNPARRKELVANARKAAEMFYGPNVASYLKEKLSEKKHG